MHNSCSLFPECGCPVTSCFKLDFPTMMYYTMNHESEKPPSPLSRFCQGIFITARGSTKTERACALESQESHYGHGLGEGFSPVPILFYISLSRCCCLPLHLSTCWVQNPQFSCDSHNPRTRGWAMSGRSYYRSSLDQ